MTTSIEELRKQLDKSQELAAMDLSNWDGRTKPGMEGLVKKAKESTENLREQLAQEIVKNSSALILLNDINVNLDIYNSNALVELDFLDIENLLFRKIYQKGQEAFPVNAEFQSKLNILLTEVADKLGINYMPAVRIPASSYGVSPSKSEIISRLETILYETYGNDLKNIALQKQLASAAKNSLEQNELLIIIKNVPVNGLQVAKALTNKSAVLTITGDLPNAIKVETEEELQLLLDAAIRKLNAAPGVDENSNEDGGQGTVQ